MSKNRTTFDLFIEYIGLEGNTKVISNGGDKTNGTFVLIQTNERMTYLPVSLCDFRIFQMDISYNKIYSLDG